MQIKSESDRREGVIRNNVDRLYLLVSKVVPSLDPVPDYERWPPS